MQKIAILILAAGSSSRMGTAKQLLPYKKTTLLGWAIQQVKKTKANSTFCVLGANATIIKEQIDQYKIETIFNADFKNGLSTSIIAGVNHIIAKNFDSVLITLADQPNIKTKYLDELIITSKENPKKIIVSNYETKIGVPAIFPKNYFNQLLNLKGDKGASIFLNNNISETIKMLPFNLIDIDTKEDYQKLINK